MCWSLGVHTSHRYEVSQRGKQPCCTTGNQAWHHDNLQKSGPVNVAMWDLSVFGRGGEFLLLGDMH